MDFSNMTTTDVILRAADKIDSMIDLRARELGLTRRWVDILLILDEHPGLSQTSMRDLSTMDRSTLATVMGSMRKKKLITDKVDKDDKRARQNYLTDYGKGKVKDARKLRDDVEELVQTLVGTNVKMRQALQHLAEAA